MTAANRCFLMVAALGAAGSGWAQSPLGLQDALATTLREHPVARIAEQQVSARAGILREATGQFDPVYAATARQGFAAGPLPGSYGIGAAASNATSVNGSATQLLRSGILAGPEAGVDRVRDRLINSGGLNQAHLGMNVTVPLLRNRGTAVVAARENSAAARVEVSRFDLNQTFSDLLANTGVAYWQAVFAERLVNVARSSEQRGESILANVEELVNADRIPRNDIFQVRANLAGRRANRIEAEQDALVARQQLALAMGLAPAAMAGLGPLSDALPTMVPAIGDDPAQLRRLAEQSLNRRSDYRAVQREIDARRIELEPARNALKPAVDVVFSAGYSGLREGVYPTSYLRSLVQGVRGPDATAGVRYQFAPRNNAAAGRLVQTEAAVRQAEFSATETARGITAGIVIAAGEVRNAARRLEQARESVAAFQDALDGEREKYRLGFGSLVDVLTIEDRLTGALEVEAQAQLDAATGMARLRLATGTLVPPDATTAQADALLFLTLPEVLP